MASITEQMLAGTQQRKSRSRRDPLTLALSGPRISNQGFGSGILSSTLSSMGPEFIGMSPTEEAAVFREGHPGWGLASQLVGLAVPYGGLLKATKMGVNVLGGASALARGAAAAEAQLSVASKIPILGKSIKVGLLGGDALADKHFAAGAVKEMIRWAPVEAERVGLAWGLGGDPKNVAYEAAINIPAAGVIGGGIRVIKEALPATKSVLRQSEAIIGKHHEDWDLAAAPMKKWQNVQAYKKLWETTGTKLPERLVTAFDEVEEAMKLETLAPKGKIYLNPLENKSLNYSAFNQLFQKGSSKLRTSLVMLEDTAFAGEGKTRIAGFSFEGPTGRDKLRNLHKTLGWLPEDLSHIAAPTHITTKTNAEAIRVRKLVQQMLPGGEDGQFIAREADNGLWLMAKHVKGRAGVKEVGAKLTKRDVQPIEEWVVWLTDKPAKFSPSGQNLADDVRRQAYWRNNSTSLVKGLDELVQKGSPIAQALQEGENWVSSQAKVPMGKVKGRVDRLAAKVGEKMDPKLREELTNVREITHSQLKQFLSPGISAFSDFAPFKALFGKARSAYAMADALTIEAFAGKITSSSIKPMFGSKVAGLIFRGQTRTGGIEALIRELDDVDLEVISWAHETMASMEAIIEEFPQASKKVLGFIKALDDLDAKQITETKAIAKFTENFKFSPKKYHRLLSRTWTGKRRVPVFSTNEHGHKSLWALGSGHSMPEALESAEAIVRGMASKDPKLKLSVNYSDRFTSGGIADDVSKLINEGVTITETEFRLLQNVLKEKSASVARPLRYQQRTDIKGYKTKLNKQDLRDSIFKSLHSTNVHNTDKLFRKYYEAEIAKWTGIRPDLGVQFNNKLTKFGGGQGPVSKSINAYADKVIGPLLGKNSASKITRAVNQSMFTLTLGMGDLAFPAINAVSFLQTVLPQVAFIMTAPAERIAGVYTPQLVMGKKGATVVNALDPWKLTMGAFKRMWSAKGEELEWLIKSAEEGTTTPRYIEGFVGDLADRVSGKGWKAVLDGEEGFVSWLNAVQKWLPGKSEEFTRTHAYFTGREVGEKFLNLEGEKLHRWATEFTYKTMFGYSAAERPELLAGPVGGLYGLFKTWTINYLDTLLELTGEGVQHQNWKPLLWSMAGTGAIAGAGGVTGYGFLDAASQSFSDKSLMTNIYNKYHYDDQPAIMQKGLDVAMYGIPAFFDVTVQSRAMTPGAHPRAELDMLFSIATVDRAKWGIQGFSEAMLNWGVTGQHPARSRATRDLMARAVMPRTVYKAMQTVRTNGINSLRNQNPLISNTTLPEDVGFATGFTPLRLAKTYAAATELAKAPKKRLEGHRVWGKEFAQAFNERRFDRIGEIIKVSSMQGYDPSAIMRSGMQQAREMEYTPNIISRRNEPWRVQAIESVYGLDKR